MQASRLLVALVSLFAAGCASGLASPRAATATQFVITATLQPTATAFPATMAGTATSAPTAAPVEGMTSTQVYVRPQPAASGAPLGMIAAATTVEIRAKDLSGAWYEIVYTGAPDGSGWVASQFVNVKDKDLIPVQTGTPGAGPPGMITQQVNVRNGPGAGFDALGRLNAQDAVTLIGRDSRGAWLQIQYAGGPTGKGWVAAEFVKANQPDELPVVAQSGEVPGTAVPTEISATTTPTVAAASDQDSAIAPAADVTFSPLGAGSILYSSDLSAPVGDGADWIRFTPNEKTVTISLACTGNAPIETQLTQNATRINYSSVPACGKSALVSVTPGLPYTIKLFLSRTQGELQYVRYELTIHGAP